MKNVIYLLARATCLLTLLMVSKSCEEDNSPDNTPVNRESIAQQYFAVLGFDDLATFDIEPWMNTLTDDVKVQDPYGSPPLEGKEAVQSFGENLAGLFQNNRFTADYITTSGEYAAVKFSWAGALNDGSETPFANQGIDVIRITDEGLVSEIFGYWNPTLSGGDNSVRMAGVNYFNSLNSVDLSTFNPDEWLATLDPQVISEDPVGGPVLQGHDQLRQFAEGLAGVMQSIQFTLDYQFVASNRTAIKWTASAMAVNGAPLQWEGIDVLEVDTGSGLITRILGYWDNSIFQP